MITYPKQGRVPALHRGWTPDECMAWTRNGGVYCSGLEILDYGNRVRINPIARRTGQPARNGGIEIPRNADVIDMICAELQAMKRPVRASDPSLDEEG